MNAASERPTGPNVAPVPSEHERQNRSFWDQDADAYQALHGDELRATPTAWGVWRIPESELGVLGDTRGCAVLELGCGAADWSIALARGAAFAVALDQSEGQLRHARRRVGEENAAVQLVMASGERVPFADGSFDVVFCDHGAMSFCDPDASVSEVARLLRRGGRLVFCATHPLLYVAWDDAADVATHELRASWFDLGYVPQSEGTADWVLTPGDWIRCFTSHGLVVDELVEVRAPVVADTTYTDFVAHDWARRWPAEQLWRVHKA